MATVSKKKARSKNCSSDWNEADLVSSLSEEQRLLQKSKATEKTPTKFDKLVNQMTNDRLNEELEKRQLSTSGSTECRRIRLKNHDKPREQEFDFIAVVDFECTCEENVSKYPNEIIEFPLVLINVREQTIIDKFQYYCQPTINPILSEFCKKLTGIQQQNVDKAPRFDEVLENVEKWLNARNLLTPTSPYKIAFATDGPWDFREFLQSQCQFSQICYPEWAERWIDIRKEFSDFYGFRRGGVQKMLERLDFQFEGQPHSGIDDATNIARIAVQMIKDGCILTLNNGLPKKDEVQKKTDDDGVVFEN